MNNERALDLEDMATQGNTPLNNIYNSPFLQSAIIDAPTMAMNDDDLIIESITAPRIEAEVSPSAIFENEIATDISVSTMFRKSDVVEVVSDAPKLLLTRFRSDQDLIGKSYVINDDGNRTPGKVSTLFRGKATKLRLSAREFASLIPILDCHDGISFDVHDDKYPDEVDVGTVDNENPQRNKLAHSKANYDKPNCAGWLLVDHDYSEFGRKFTDEQLLEILKKIDPRIANATRIVRKSTSSCVHKIGELPDEKGFHIYIGIKNAKDAKRYSDAIFNALWVEGYGYIALSKNGSCLIKSPIDGVVNGPARKVFIGAPKCGPGLAYTAPKVSYKPGELLDTELLPSPTKKDIDRALRMQKDAKSAIKPDSVKQEQKYYRRKVKEMVDRGVEQIEAEECIHMMASGEYSELMGPFLLYFTHLDEPVSVDYVLANGASFDRMSLADPIEGPSYGTATAMMFWNSGSTPIINSHAHGGFTYFLKSLEWKSDYSRHVAAWNEGHINTIWAGMHVIMRREKNAFGRVVWSPFKRRELELLYSNKMIQVGEKHTRAGSIPDLKNLVEAWAIHPDARTCVNGVTFAPGKDLGSSYLNLWTGFSIEPKENHNLLTRVYWHIEHILCAGNQEHFKYTLNWVARNCQHPEKQGMSALVLIGDEGTGKGVFLRFVGSLFGQHSRQLIDSNQITGQFNSQLADCVFLYADECFFAKDKASINKLKAMVTEPTLPIEKKGYDLVDAPNYLSIAISTNEEFAVHASRNARRWFVLEASLAKRGDREYFDLLNADCTSDTVRAAFLYDMLHLDLSGWNPGDVPETSGLRKQRQHSFPPHKKWFAECLNDANFDGTSDIMFDKWPTKMSSEDLFVSYQTYCDTAKIRQFDRIDKTLLSQYLGEMFKRKRLSFKDCQGMEVRRPRGIEFGALINARTAFEKHEHIQLIECL